MCSWVDVYFLIKILKHRWSPHNVKQCHRPPIRIDGFNMFSIPAIKNVILGAPIALTTLCSKESRNKTMFQAQLLKLGSMGSNHVQRGLSSCDPARRKSSLYQWLVLTGTWLVYTYIFPFSWECHHPSEIGYIISLYDMDNYIAIHIYCYFVVLMFFCCFFSWCPEIPDVGAGLGRHHVAGLPPGKGSTARRCGRAALEETLWDGIAMRKSLTSKKS